MRGFFDHNLSPYMARAVHVIAERMGDEACAKKDKFDSRTKDIDWLASLGRETGWTIFSGDLRILRNPIEKRAFRDAGLTGFFLKPAVAKQPVTQQTATILWHWAAIKQLLALQERGAYWLPVNKGSKFTSIQF